MNPGHVPRLALLALSTLLLHSGCALLPPGRKAPPKPPRPPVSEIPPAKRQSFWRAEGVEGDPWIVVVLGEQRAYFFKGKTIVGDTRISSGKKTFETPAGEYRVIQKDKNHVSNLYGKLLDAEGNVVKGDADMSKDKVPEGGSFAGAKMPNFLRFHGGYGMHAGRVPGYRASHGCVRLPAAMAAHFFEHAEMGTPVSVIEYIPAEKPHPPRKKRPSWWPFATQDDRAAARS
jgi:hypothetical protein